MLNYKVRMLDGTFAQLFLAQICNITERKDIREAIELEILVDVQESFLGDMVRKVLIHEGGSSRLAASTEKHFIRSNGLA